MAIKQFDAGLLFSGHESGTMVTGYDAPSPYTPKIDPDYILHDASRDLIVWFLMEHPDPIYLYGSLGCGKSSSVKQIAARLNYPVYEVTGHGRMEFSDLVGHLTVENGNMVFQYGALSLAMKHGGIFLLNEIDLTPPEVASGLNTILDGSPLCISENGGEIITPNPMFRFVATANTNGNGDETGIYQGVLRQNAAFLDRFILCEIKYPTPDIEKNLLKNKFKSLPEKLVDKMVEFANEIREAFIGSKSSMLDGGIDITFSTRSLVRWCDLTLRFQALARQGIQPVVYALDRAIGFRATKETRNMMHELSQRMFTRVVDIDEEEKDNNNPTGNLSGDTALNYVTELCKNPTKEVVVTLKKTHQVKTGMSTKIWKATADKSQLIVQWGRLGNALQDKVFALNECQNGSPYLELHLRVIDKLKEGYELVPASTTSAA